MWWEHRDILVKQSYENVYVKIIKPLPLYDNERRNNNNDNNNDNMERSTASSTLRSSDDGSANTNTNSNDDFTYRDQSAITIECDVTNPTQVLKQMQYVQQLVV